MTYKIKVILSIAAIIVNINCDNDSEVAVGNPLIHAHPCVGNDDVTASYEPRLPPDVANQYNIYIKKDFIINAKIVIKLDSEANVTLNDEDLGTIDAQEDNTFEINLLKENNGISFNIKGVNFDKIPYITSININSDEICRDHLLGYFDKYLIGQGENPKKTLNEICGRGRTKRDSVPNKDDKTQIWPGEWPWLATIHRVLPDHHSFFEGTLISKNLILTVAHLVTQEGVTIDTKQFTAFLNYEGPDQEEREVQKIILNPGFKNEFEVHDLALLKLESDVVFSRYIIPICIWDTKSTEAAPSSYMGVIAGYGTSSAPHDTLERVRENKMRRAPNWICKASQPDYYPAYLTEEKFCAENDENVCVGNYGSPLMVILPNENGLADYNDTSVWYVKGVLQHTTVKPSGECDPEHYFVFSDVDKQSDWMLEQIKENE